MAAVAVPLDTPSPRLTVLHIADWHFVDATLFAADERTHDPGVADQAIGDRYAAFLAEVAAVQDQQRAVLRHLSYRHGLRVVYVERLTDGLLGPYQELSRTLAGVDPALLRESVERAERDGDADALAFARLAEDQYEEDRLNIGVAGVLWAGGDVSELRPLEDEAAHAAANPLREDGTLRFDAHAQAAREKAMADRLLAAREPLVAVVLGGSHDLTDDLKAAGGVRLIRVEVEAWRKAVAGE